MRQIASPPLEENKLLIDQCCSLAMRAHSSCSTASPFLLLRGALQNSSTIFAFPGSWSAEDWVAADAAAAAMPFGDADLDLSLFPSLTAIGDQIPARANLAFLRSFHRLLATSTLRGEVQRSMSEKKRIVFTGHSSGGSVSVFATIWLLEQCFKLDNSNQVTPFCVTFGCPLVGDSVFCHALLREDWSRCFLHLVMPLDIVPRILLSPLSSFKDEFQAILHFLCPKSLYFSLDSIGKSPLVAFIYSTVLRSGLSISSHKACLSMGCSSSLLGALSAFVDLTPYRPFGTYVFCTDNGRLLSVKNSDAILQLLYYCFQLSPEQDVLDIACRSLKEHLQYESQVKEYLRAHNVVYMDCLGTIPLTSNDEYSDQMPLVGTLLDELELSMEARLSLRAAGEWEKQRLKNQVRIDANYNKIQEAQKFLNGYRATCEMRGLGYYDSFKLQRENEDFNANVKRLELAGLWDEIVDMLRRYQLPDGFEGRTEWIKLGTTYRSLVEPLDIANYYRHAKNEDTGPYMAKGRPKRYIYTQRWLEHAPHLAVGSSLESCFWAMVEELCFDTSNGKTFDEVKERVLELEKEVLHWFTTGKLGRDVLLDGSTFVNWWRSLPRQHRLESCIANFMNGEEKPGK